mmetsp:Transcript_3495/g.5950  ORF Transcript_3495/g.5950 Transcript_3495/m.5950 type:complete len:167 (+) Transcript_3495:369-869(+)
MQNEGRISVVDNISEHLGPAEEQEEAINECLKIKDEEIEELKARLEQAKLEFNMVVHDMRNPILATMQTLEHCIQTLQQMMSESQQFKESVEAADLERMARNLTQWQSSLLGGHSSQAANREGDLLGRLKASMGEEMAQFKEICSSLEQALLASLGGGRLEPIPNR